MKRFIIFIITISVIFFQKSFAQESTSLAVLDNYLILDGVPGVIVGRVLPPATGQSVTLVNDTSELFTIDTNNYIRLKDKVKLNTCSAFRYGLSVKCGNQTKDFEIVKDNFLRNGVIAHRGAWKNQNVSQNSMESLEKAIELGCEASELDVWMSSDNRVILSHDPIVNGKAVEETTWVELLKTKLDQGGFIPGLEEYLQRIKKQNKTRLVIEIKKSEKGKDRLMALTDSVVQIVHRYKAQAWVDYISFDYDALLRIRKLDPTANISYLEANMPLELMQVDAISGIDYKSDVYEKDPDLIDKAHELGFTTNVWTVNNLEKLSYFLNKTIDYITTDEPEALLKLIDKSKN